MQCSHLERRQDCAARLGRMTAAAKRCIQIYLPVLDGHMKMAGSMKM
jgi:hypothetical protein